MEERFFRMEELEYLREELDRLAKVFKKQNDEEREHEEYGNKEFERIQLMKYLCLGLRSIFIFECDKDTYYMIYIYHLWNKLVRIKYSL